MMPPLLLALLSLARLTAAADPVKVSVYYETLCPDSEKFVITQLYPVYQELKDIMLLDVNAYGKAEDYAIGDSYIFVCQHGPDECEGNMMIACAKKLIQSEDLFMAFTNCVMTVFTAAAAGPQCAEKHGIDFAPIQRCYASSEGRRLLHEVGVKQRTAAPDLHYVPWIMINDAYTDNQQTEAEKDLKKVVCDAYKGEKPAACGGGRGIYSWRPYGSHGFWNWFTRYYNN
ncbi:hypothetical protein O3P69_017989 [Scylla paramamosain]|uniref:Gamma-interferon-inducible lysosomal thiol reductase n=2 Tax=Scylla paramamosain TaxID=85552 RepID=A0AAW0THH6_SCYPA